MATPMLVAPVAGALADRFGNRPFMLTGLVLQASGLGWLAAVTHPGVSYAALVAPLIVAGIGISMCFRPWLTRRPQLSPGRCGGGGGHQQCAQCPGRRVRGGHPGRGIRRSRQLREPVIFIAGFRPSEWVAAAVAAVGVIAAVLAPSKRQLSPASAPAPGSAAAEPTAQAR